MQNVKITEWVDIQAPRDEVFDLVVDIEKRMQLSPLWGLTKIENPSHDYPNKGSSYDIEIPEAEGSCFETIVTQFEPRRKLAYQSLLENKVTVTWNLQEVQGGTRLVYVEEFLSDESESEDLRESVRKIVKDWLKNIRRYAELRGVWTKCWLRKLIDRFYLNQQPAQRKTITTILFMQAVSTITFIMAALAAGLASLLF
jgi:uncharacterized protein YndB with AHSA1/START domain